MLITRDSLKPKQKDVIETPAEKKEETENVETHSVSSSSFFVEPEANTDQNFSEKLVESLCVLVNGTSDFELLDLSTKIISKKVREMEIKKQIEELEFELKKLNEDE